QQEVAQRIVATNEDNDFGVLSLLLQLRYEPRDIFQISSECFFPPPEVESACTQLVRRSEPLLSAEQADVFKKIVKRGFSQRRKMMLKLLKQDWPKEKLESVFAELNISPQERAEKISLETFVELTKMLL
ncbi:MAG: ribosomal RNA small subunit methyltransferase A, partial [Limisphaerales bacterium]